MRSSLSQNLRYSQDQRSTKIYRLSQIDGVVSSFIIHPADILNHLNGNSVISPVTIVENVQEELLFFTKYFFFSSYKLQLKMNLNPMKWKTRSLAYYGFGLFVFYILLIYKWAFKVEYNATIENSKPEHVWEYVADFSNMMKLNPTIEKFNIINESGNYDHWKYSVEYTEHLSHLPMIQNTAHGHYAVYPKSDSLAIESKHRTCFLLGMSCLNTDSEFIFKSKGTDTVCVEKIKYECPLLFSILCYKELMYQREEIMTNLQNHFSVINNKYKL